MPINKIDMICFVYRGQLVQLHVCLHHAHRYLATGAAEYFALFLVTEKLRSGKPDCNRGQGVPINIKLQPLSGRHSMSLSQSHLSFKKIILCFSHTEQLQGPTWSTRDTASYNPRLQIGEPYPI